MQDVLFAQIEFLNDFPVPIDALFLQVFKKLPAFADHPQQALAGMMILPMLIEMGGQFVDPVGEKCDLHFRGTGVGGRLAVLLDDVLLLFFRE